MSNAAGYQHRGL